MKIRAAVCLTLSVLLLLCPVLAAAGGAGDPLASISWLYQTWLADLQLRFTDIRMSKLDASAERLGSRLDEVQFPETVIGEYSLADTGHVLSVQDGGTVSLNAFASFTVEQGSIRVTALSGELLDLTIGETCEAGSFLSCGHRYFAAEDSLCELKSYSETASGMVDGYYRLRETGDFSLDEQFLDIDSHWGKGYILELAGRSLVNGLSAHTFSPDTQVTRAMFVTVLARLCGADTSYSGSSFTDVKAGDWYAPYVEWAAKYKIVTGYEDGNFAPNAPITREQMALILCRFCDAYGYQPEDIAEHTVFADGDSISSWAAEAVERARSWGIISGKGNGIFDPKGTATRAEMCAVITRLSDAAGIRNEGD